MNEASSANQGVTTSNKYLSGFIDYSAIRCIYYE